uniref:Uncharacterized protein n=1 Tax=Panagrolaimus sp. PS1159 TaxID=55785 RepID=A0AC35FHE1_9BILA
MTKSKTPALSATIFNRKHSWKNFFCGTTSAADHWVDGPATSSFVLPIPQEEDEMSEFDEENNELSSPIEYLERQQLLSPSSFSRDDGFEDGEKINNL